MYLEASLLSWLDEWEEAVQASEGTNYDFYQSVASLLRAFVELDAFVLTYEEGDDQEEPIDTDDEPNITLH